MKNNLVSSFLLLACGSAMAAEPVQVMVLGTYHFANQNLDVMNVKADDMLTAKRQAELKAVADGLARFRPNTIALEREADDQPGRTLPAYRNYLAGQDTQHRSEITQIGYRLASQLGLRDVIGVDYKNDFPFAAVQQFAAAAGQDAQFKSQLAAAGAKIKEFNEYQKTETIGQLLRRVNDPAFIKEQHGTYMELLAYGADVRQPGAELLGLWSARNLGICARLRQALKPGDRAVLMFGRGHAYHLRQCVLEMPGWQLVEPNTYLPG